MAGLLVLTFCEPELTVCPISKRIWQPGPRVLGRFTNSTVQSTGRVCVLGRKRSDATHDSTAFLVTHDAVEQSLAADGAIACFSSSFFNSAWMLIARRS